MLSRLKIGPKLGLSFAVGLGLFTVLSVVAYRGIINLIEQSKWEAHTYEVLGGLEKLTSDVNAAESQVRGYAISGQTEYLPAYEDILNSYKPQLQGLRRLTSDNPNQQRRLDQLEPLITARFDRLREGIRLRREQGFEALQRQVQTRQGQQLQNEIRTLIAAMENEEQSLLKRRASDADLASRQTLDTILYGVPLYFVLLVLLAVFLSRNISDPLHRLSSVSEQVGVGNLTIDLPELDRQDEIGTLTRSFNRMIANLRQSIRINDEQTWLQSNLAETTRLLQGRRNQETIGNLLLSKLAPLVNAQQGVFYLLDSTADVPVLKLVSSYAYQERKQIRNQFRLGEGLVGQCALEKKRILLTQVPGDYTRIASGLGELPPLNVIVLPVLFEEQVVAAIELASLHPFTESHIALLDQLSETVGIILNTIAADLRTAQLLEESQALTEELQQQQTELQQSNFRLEEQAEELRASEEMLKQQQHELQQSNEELQQLNEELEEKAELLAVQKQEVERKNDEIEQARSSLEAQAAQLALSSKYKSEFLANMSHELRTPLNSLLILARLLSQNGDGNLTSKQVEYSSTIYAAGTDLLTLINDILDLAKIESGTMSIELQALEFTELRDHLERTFHQMADDRTLTFQIELDASLSPTLTTDPKRLQQILKNLLSNAFKFTEQGSVTLTISPCRSPASHPDAIGEWIAFAVSDTGVGIAPEKQRIIFEAFQQADGTTSRKYGGTGLGLSISRELAHLLGGTIALVSQPDQGSTFTLYLPLMGQSCPLPAPAAAPSSEPVAAVALPAAVPASPLPASPLPEVSDDRGDIQSGDRVLLIIEDDVNFVRVLTDLARQQGFKVLVALRSRTGLALAQQFKPNAIMLDIRLPDVDGWAVLDQLKHNPNTRHIPVHILSVDDAQQRGLQLGAIAVLQKPVPADALDQAFNDIKHFIDRRVRNLLVVEDDRVQAESIRELIGEGDVKTTIAATGQEALQALRSDYFDCVVLDLGLPDLPGFELIERIKKEPGLSRLPIVVYTGKELTPSEETQLKRLAETIIVKDVRSPERLLDETALFLHRVQANLPQPKREILEQLHQTDPVLSNKTVLIVDDDVRNIFALTSLLEGYEMTVLYAENGRDAIAKLTQHPETNAVLMDVMMPEMDGYETTRAIRQQDSFRTLPIIALTAKAMQGDREKCLQAGASDYITKPVDTEQLLSLLRVWLYR